MDLVDSKVALVEIGDNEKIGYLTVRGSLEDLHNEPAHTYWYPADITFEEFLTEVQDLAENYEHIAILTPLPDRWGLIADTFN